MSKKRVKHEPKPILFLLGPSGVGKSTLASWVAKDLGLLHLEIDRFPEGDGIDLEGLRAEWDAFGVRMDIGPLAGTLTSRAHTACCPGVILSFPSGFVPTSEHLESASRAGIRVLVLYGTGAECMEAFLHREKASGRGLGSDHWIQNNAQSYAVFSTWRFAAHRVLAFERGKFRSRPKLMAEVKALLQPGTLRVNRLSAAERH